MTTRRILITGATGKQGGALINSLLSSPLAPSLKLYAITRNAMSPAALALAKRNVTLITGDIAISSSQVFQQYNDLTSSAPLDAAFLVTALTPPKLFGKKPPTEEEQGFPFIDAAVENGVKHLVFASVQRGIHSDTDPTDIPHFASKYHVEKHLKEKAAAKMMWTIIRPVCFMDNATPDFIGRTFIAMWKGLGDKPLQMVSVHDIGVFAARTILNPAEWAGRAIELAGDELTLEEGSRIFKKVFGTEMPVGSAVVGTLVKTLVAEMGTMFRWFATDGFGADVKWCKEQGATGFEEWLRKESKFKGLGVEEVDK